jgi:hypothetical protein
LGVEFSRQGHQIAFALMLAVEVIGFLWLVLAGPPAFDRR